MKRLSPSSPALPRRGFLQWLWTIPLAVAALQLLGMAERFSFPRRKAGTYGTIIDIGPLAELPEAGSMPLHQSRGRFWLVNSGEGLLAISHTCSHLECLFDWDREAGCFICPCHGSRFDRLGRVLTGPATKGLDRFPLRIALADGMVLAETDTAGNPLPVPFVAPVTGEGGQLPPRLHVDTGRKIVASLINHVS